MRKSIKAGISACLTAALLSLTAFAAPVPHVSYDGYTGKLAVSGEAENGTVVTLMILKSGKSFNAETKEIADDEVFYCDQYVITDKEFDFEINFDGVSGTYMASIADTAGKTREEFEIQLVNPTAYASAIAAINSAAEAGNADDFAEVFDANAANLGFDTSLSGDEAVEMLYAYVKETPLSEKEYEKNAGVFAALAVSEGINNGTVSDVSEYIDDIYFADESLREDFLSVAKSAKISEYITSKMADKDIEDLDGFYDTLAIGTVLGAVRYSDGTGTIIDMLEKYGDLVGITGTISKSACEAVNGKDYDAVSLPKAYNNAKGTSSSGSPSSGSIGSGSSGNGSGGGTRGGSVTGGGTIGLPSESEDTGTKSVNASYNDIEGYDWASEAILALTDKGIVNGKGNGKFAPEDNVLREEFAKILLGAMGYDGDTNGNIFTDVEEGSWYCGWVNRAAELGVLKGIGNGMFGTGANITREDMCVMIVNALKMTGTAAAPAELIFEDTDEISDYARESVAILYSMGAVNGVTETLFSPKGQATRAQAAKIVYSVLDKLQ